MQVEIVKTIIETVDVSLPMYLKCGEIHFYKIYSEHDAIQLCNSKYSHNSISEVGISVALNGDYEHITKKEFEHQFHIVLTNLKEKIK
jgi:hypothetical protein